MENAILINQLYTVLYNAAVLAGPPLLLATILGLCVSILQTITQIQDQSLPQTVKIIAIVSVFIFMGSSLTAPLYNSADLIFREFPNWVG
ncbi:MAG: flagellar biosynthetic protein FliQ [Pseudomonadota bacterium]